MSSTNKTNNLGLNSWIASDKPKRADFNSDNAILDKTIAEHISNTVMHITEEERESWNDRLYVHPYAGTGEESRIIQTSCAFEPGLTIVFPVSTTPINADFDEGLIYYYFAFGAKGGTCPGLMVLDGNRVSVKQQPSNQAGCVLYRLNQVGTLYFIVQLRL